MKIKIDAQGHAELKDGKPVYVKDDGEETAFDAPGAMQKIQSLQKEARRHRLKAEEAMERLQVLDGVEDPETFVGEAKQAMEAMAAVRDGRFVGAEDAARDKDEAVARIQGELTARLGELEGELAEATNQLKTAKGDLAKQMITARFATSRYASERLAVPADMARARFEAHFGVEDGRVVARDDGGLLIHSRARPEQPADFDEALEILVESYPGRDTILRGAGGGGFGSPTGGSAESSRTRSDLTSPALKSRFIADNGLEAFKRLPKE